MGTDWLKWCRVSCIALTPLGFDSPGAHVERGRDMWKRLALATATAALSAILTAPQALAYEPVQPGHGQAVAERSERHAQPIELCPVTAYGSQAELDTGSLVLWMTEPAYWLAGHNTMGWRWLDTIPSGTRLEVTCGPAEGTYVAYDHEWQTTKGGPIPGWAYSGPDLVTQTCTGEGSEPSGMGFTLFHKVAE